MAKTADQVQDRLGILAFAKVREGVSEAERREKIQALAEKVAEDVGNKWYEEVEVSDEATRLLQELEDMHEV